MAGRGRPAPRRPRGRLPSPVGAAWCLFLTAACGPGGGAVGLQVWPPLSVATAVQGTCSRCEFCGPDPCPRVRLWWVRVCCDKPPGGGQELESHVPPQWGGRGVSDQRQACLWLPAPGSATRLPCCHSLSRGSCSYPTWPPAAQVVVPHLRTEARLCPESEVSAHCRGCGQGGGGTVLAAQSGALSGLSQQVPPASLEQDSPGEARDQPRHPHSADRPAGLRAPSVRLCPWAPRLAARWNPPGSLKSPLPPPPL